MKARTSTTESNGVKKNKKVASATNNSEEHTIFSNEGLRIEREPISVRILANVSRETKSESDINGAISDNGIKKTVVSTGNLRFNSESTDKSDHYLKIAGQRTVSTGNVRLASESSTTNYRNTINSPERVASISGQYKNDYNIMQIHKVIMQNFEYDRQVRQIKSEKELRKLRDKLEKPMSGVDRKMLEESIRILDEDLNKIITRSEEKQYNLQSKEVLDAYQKLPPVSKKIIFGSTSDVIDIEDNDKEERLDVISRYLDIAKKYLDVNVVRQVEIDPGCPGCGYNIYELSKDMHFEFFEYCPRCDTELSKHIPNEITHDKTNLPSGYDDLQNFIKEMQCYEGTQKTKIHDNLLRDLDEYFLAFKLPLSEEIKKKPLNPDGSRGKTDRDLMYRALHDTGYVKYYADINLICNIYWGWILPNISGLREILIQDYIRLQPIYHIVPKVRKSNLTRPFRLYKQLQLRGHPCSPSHFKLAKEDSLKEQEAIWKEMMKIAAQKFPKDDYRYISG